MLKTLIIATVLLPSLAIAQQSQQLPQPRQPGQWCPVGWMASGSYCAPGAEKAPTAILKDVWCPADRRESGSYSSAEAPAAAGILTWRFQVIAQLAEAESVAPPTE
jgi:hypothetical protein